MINFVDQHTLSKASREARERVARQLSTFIKVRTDSKRAVTYLSASLEQVLFFLFERMQLGLAASTVRRDASLIDALRESTGLPRFAAEPAMREFLRAVTRARPAGAKFEGVVVYSPRQLVPSLLQYDAPPFGPSFMALRERCLFTLRVVTLMRGGSAWSVRRSSIKAVCDPIGRPIVMFHYDSKGAAANNMAHDSNYVEHLEEDTRRCDRSLCPAHLLLQLRDVVERLDREEHDRLFTSEIGAALSVNSVRTLMSKLLRRAQVAPVFTSHSLRMSSSVTLKLLGVADQDVCVRAGWHTGTASSTRSRHYLYGRGVRDNFARLLLLPGRDSS